MPDSARSPASTRTRAAHILAGASLAIAFALVAACGSSSSTTAGTTGTGCTSGATCAGGVCAISPDFPDGYCTQGCTLGNAASCPAGSVCIDDASGVPADAGVSAICYQACQSDTDCTLPGFKCLEKASQKVCRNGT